MTSDLASIDRYEQLAAALPLGCLPPIEWENQYRQFEAAGRVTNATGQQGDAPRRWRWMVSVVLLMIVASVVVVYAVVRTASERRAQARGEAALGVLGRVRRYPVDMGDEQLHHDEAGHQRLQHRDQGADGFHVRVLGTSGPDDPRGIPRPIPVVAVPPKDRLWATSQSAIAPDRAGLVPADPADVAADPAAVGVGLGGAEGRPDAPPPLLRLGSYDDGNAEPPSPGEPPTPLPPTQALRGHQPRRASRTTQAALAAAACLVLITIASTLNAGGSARPDPKSDADASSTTNDAISTTNSVAPTTTEAPTPPPPVLIRSDDAGAEYRLTGGFGVEVRAAGTVYVRVDGPDGATLFEKILYPGQKHSFLSSGPVRVRVGNASAAQIVVNSTAAIPLPATSSPFNLDLRTGDL